MVQNNLLKILFFVAALSLISSNCLAASVKHSIHHQKQSIKHKKFAHSSNKHKHIAKKTHYAHHKKTKMANRQPAIIDTNTLCQNNMGFVAAIQKRLVEMVHTTLTNLHYSAYRLGGKHFDLSHGVYVVDCSSYVDNILEKVTPDAYSSLVDSTGSDAPTSQHYYDFFTGLTYESNEFWNKIEDVEQLRPGDILVFRYRKPQRPRGGHVMVVMNKPIRYTDSYLVSVADSAPTGHSEDTRDPRVSGIGIGTLLLKVNPKTGHPSAYAWKVGSRWEKNVNFAMARPIELGSSIYR